MTSWLLVGSPRSLGQPGHWVTPVTDNSLMDQFVRSRNQATPLAPGQLLGSLNRYGGSGDIVKLAK